MLRAKEYAGPVTLAGDEEPGPIDRPNLSKDFLAGTATEDWIPLRTREYYESIQVELVTGDPAVRISPADHQVSLRSGRTLNYGALLLATGADPRSLSIAGSDLPHVHRLRTLADSKAIIAKAQRVRSCAVIGSGFIGLEVAASLRQRGFPVSVIGQDSVPLGKVLGVELGRFIQALHEQHGVRFLLNATPHSIRKDRVEMGDGQFVEAELVVLGVGVSPRTSLAEGAGITVDNGVVVSDTLRTSAPNVFGAGDLARYPERVSGEQARIEHWVLAERQGHAVARSMLGIGSSFREAPFFWSQHYDVTISDVGYAPSWEWNTRQPGKTRCLRHLSPEAQNDCRRDDRARSPEPEGRGRYGRGRHSFSRIHSAGSIKSTRGKDNRRGGNRHHRERVGHGIAERLIIQRENEREKRFRHHRLHMDENG